MRIRKHRHRWAFRRPSREDGAWYQVIYCKVRGCRFSYEQGLLFDADRYAV
jgi:hypothetical protein